MSESKFKVGDVVVLKSGGPAMTVCSVGVGPVHCKWFPQGDYAKTVWEPFGPETLMSEEEAEALLEDGDDEDDEVTQ
jgi:uncharacterized protein YodC (DUF2158 family)